VTDGARGCGLPTVGSVAEVASLLAFVPAVALLEPALGVEGVAWAFTVAGVFGFVIVVARFAVAVRGRALPAA
jgi:Na+-driven multidrug efflux pump